MEVCSPFHSIPILSFVSFSIIDRTDGAGEIYAYLPLTESNAEIIAAVPPLSVENPDYGFSVGRGAFTFPSGEWVTVAERIKMNDPNATNGMFIAIFLFRSL